MTTRTVYPGVKPDGTRVAVLAQDGVTPIPDDGATVTNSEYYETLIAQQVLLDHNPVLPAGPPIDLVIAPVSVTGTPVAGQVLEATGASTATWGDPAAGSGGDTTGVLVGDLSSDPGVTDSAIKQTTGHTVKGNGGGPWYWDAGSTAATNAWECISAAGGRWRRIWSREIDVRWFGARGNASAGPGGHGDTAAIQAAIDAASAFNSELVAGGGLPGVTVRLQPTTYIVSDEGTARAWKLRIKDYVTIAGSGPGTLLQSALGQNGSARTISSVAGTTLVGAALRDFSIDDREFEQVGTFQRHAIFIYDCEDLIIERLDIRDTCDCIRLFGPDCRRVRVLDCNLHDCPHDIGREVLQAEGMRDCIISGNQIWNCPWATGIKMENAEGGHITNNVVSNNVIRNCGTGIYLIGDGVTVVGNRIIGMRVEGGIQTCGDAVVVGNYIEDVVQVGIVLANITASSQGIRCSGNTIKQVTGTGLISNGAAYGILAAANGALQPGKIQITDNCIEDFVDGTGEYYGVLMSNTTGPLVISSNVIRGATRGISFSPPAGSSLLKGVVVQGNIISLNSDGRGIAFAGDATRVLRDVSVIGNIVYPEPGATLTIGIRYEDISDYVIIALNNVIGCNQPLSADGTLTNSIVVNNFGF